MRFLKDREGRVSHHRRLGWFSPFYAAWINLRGDVRLRRRLLRSRARAASFLVLGLLFLLPVSFGAITIGPLTFSLTGSSSARCSAIVGLQGVMLGCLAKIFFDYTNRRTARLLSLFAYTRATVVAAGLFMVGVVCTIPLVVRYFSDGLRLPAELAASNHLAVTGLFFMVAGFTVFIFTLLIHAAAISTNRGAPGESDTATPVRTISAA